MQFHDVRGCCRGGFGYCTGLVDPLGGSVGWEVGGEEVEEASVGMVANGLGEVEGKIGFQE